LLAVLAVLVLLGEGFQTRFKAEKVRAFAFLAFLAFLALVVQEYLLTREKYKRLTSVERLQAAKEKRQARIY
jgi:hypothetical protein